MVIGDRRRRSVHKPILLLNHHSPLYTDCWTEPLDLLPSSIFSEEFCLNTAEPNMGSGKTNCAPDLAKIKWLPHFNTESASKKLLFYERQLFVYTADFGSWCFTSVLCSSFRWVVWRGADEADPDTQRLVQLLQGFGLETVSYVSPKKLKSPKQLALSSGKKEIEHLHHFFLWNWYNPLPLWVR